MVNKYLLAVILAGASVAMYASIFIRLGMQ